MVSELIGYFLGSMPGNAYPIQWHSIYYALDFVFLIVLSISFLVYYKMFKYISKKGLPSLVTRSFTYMFFTLVLMNIVFMGILMEFIRLRSYLEVSLPLMDSIVWAVLAISSVCLIVKTYSVIAWENPKDEAEYKLRKSKRKRGIL